MGWLCNGLAHHSNFVSYAFSEKGWFCSLGENIFFHSVLAKYRQLQKSKCCGQRDRTGVKARTLHGTEPS